MQFSTATIAAVAAFLPALVSAHVSMIYPPTVFQEVATNLNPLDPSGSNYPCFVTTGSTGEMPVYEPGSQQEIGLQGSAIHGGGSCQIAVTYDNPPTKDSVFRVIKSFEGGCPAGSTTGNLPANPTNGLPSLPYTIPSYMPSGTAVVAWTWFNKIGNREMYMRCAPIKIGGSNTDKSKFNALPEIFKANIGNGCSTTEGTNVRFPNPGPELVGAGDGEPVGNCGTTVTPPPVEEEPVEEEPVEEEPVEEEPVEEEPVEEEPVDDYKPPVLIGGPSTTSTPVSQPTPTYAPQPTNTPVVPTYVPKPDTPKRPTPTHSRPSPTEVPETGSCEHGAIICDSATTWSRCVYGKPVFMGKVAPGTKCEGGNMIKARSVRFSHDHVRHRHHSSF